MVCSHRPRERKAESKSTIAFVDTHSVYFFLFSLPFGRGARSCRARFLLLYSRYLSPNTRPTWIVNASSESCMDHVFRACSSSSPPPQFVTRCPRGAASEARPLSVRVVARKGGRGPQRVVFDARGSWITAGGTPADPFACQWIGAHHASCSSSIYPIMLHALLQYNKDWVDSAKAMKSP